MAIPSGTVWEVRTTGSDLNGGGYNSARGGADYSQQDSAQLSVTDLASVSGSTTITSATGGFTAAMAGSIVNISSGTTVVPGFYEITAVIDTNTATIDRACTTTENASGCVARVGGALATPGKAGSAHVAGNTIWLKGTDLIIDTASENVAGGRIKLAAGVSAVEPTRLYGYGTTRGDKIRAKITNSVSHSTNGLVNVSNTHTIVKNVHVYQSNSALTCYGFLGNTISHGTYNCRAENLKGSGSGYAFANIGFAVDIEAISCNVGLSCGRKPIISKAIVYNCTVSVNTSNTDSGMIIDSLFYRSGRAAIATSNGTTICYKNCTLAFLTNHGFVDFLNNSYPVQIEDCIVYGCSGYGVSCSYNVKNLYIRNCAFGANTSGNISGLTGTGEEDYNINMVNLTENPFVHAGSDIALEDADLSLNNNPGGGALCRNAGYGSFAATQSESHPDIGAITHEDRYTGALAKVVIG